MNDSTGQPAHKLRRILGCSQQERAGNMTLSGYVPMRRGLLNHLQEGRMSLLDYLVYTLLLLLADRKTGIAMTNAGGIVYFTGNQIPLRTAQDCLQRLESNGYIKRPFRVHGRRIYDAIFIDKFVCTDGALRDMRVSFANTADWNHPAYVRCAEGADSVRTECGRSAPIQEERIENNKTPTSKPDGSDHADGSAVDPTLFFHAVPENKNGGDHPNAAAVAQVWDHYILAIGKSPKVYTFTEKRRRMGKARLDDLLHRIESEPKLGKAVALMKLCIDRLAGSSFHNGKNDQHKKYVDWEILFRSKDQMERWLDDSRFEGVQQ